MSSSLTGAAFVLLVCILYTFFLEMNLIVDEHFSHIKFCKLRPSQLITIQNQVIKKDI